MTARHGVGTRWITRALACAIGVAGVASATSPALADTFLDQANKAAAASPGTKPAQDILMPALAAMTEPPVQAGWTRSDLLTLLMAAPGESEWDALEEWALDDPQQAALAALKTITTGDDRYLIGLPLGRDAVPAAWAEADLYVALNEEGLLFSASFPYLHRIGWLVGLASFEASRAAAEGDGDRALQACTHLFTLGRILTERPYLREMVAGASIMLVSLERIRDVMYQFPSAFNATKLKETAEALSSQRIRDRRLPIANYLAADQIIARTFAERGKVDGAKLAEVMSGAGAQKRSLQRLSEAAFWSDRADDQADWFDATDKLKGVWADWEQRWRLTDIHDPLFDVPSEFRRMNADSFLAVYYPLNGIDMLFEVRMRLLVELGGTLNAMGCVGFHQTNKTLPPQLASVEPRFVARLSPDLYNVDRRQPVRKYQQFQYWVPIRDQKFDRREEPHPYKITVAMVPGAGDAFTTGFQIGMALGPIARAYLLPLWGSLPDSVVDQSTGKVDLDKLRTAFIDRIDKRSWSSADIEKIAVDIRAVKSAGVTAENFDSKFDGSLGIELTNSLGSAASMGVDVNGIVAMIRDVTKAIFALPSFDNAKQTIDRGDALRKEQIVELLKGVVEIAAQPANADKLSEMATTMREFSAKRLAELGGPGLPTTTFDTTVDDSQFLLYSVGLDEQDDRARMVGPAGIDILMWPPILSLQRQAR